MARKLVSQVAVFAIIVLLVSNYLVSPSQATIYSTIQRYTDLIQDKLGSYQKHPVSQRKYVINGQILNGELGSTKLTAAQVVENLAQDDPNQLFAGQALIEQIVLQIQQGTTRPITLVTENWGLYAKVSPYQDVQQKLRRHLNNEDINEPGKPVESSKQTIVFALNKPQDMGANVWTFHLPDSTAVLELLKALNEQAPATAKTITPYPGAYRAWSLSEYTGIGETHLEIYSSEGSIISHARHFKQTLTQSGYQLNNAIVDDDSHQTLMFSGPQGLVDIMISTDATVGQVMDTIQIRPL